MATAIESIRRVRVESSISGAEQTAAGLDKIAAAQENVAGSATVMGAATDTNAKRVTSSAGAYKALMMSIDASYRSQTQIERGQNRINAALDQGIITQSEAARSLELLRSKWALNDNALNAAGKSSGRTAAQFQNLSYQINDIASGLASGQSPFTILAQQGGQLVQIAQMGEGGIAGTFGKIAASIAGLVTPANLALIGIAALGAGFLAYSALSRETLPSLNDAMKTHADLISKIKGAYGEASVAADAYARESRAVLTAQLQSDIRGLEAQMRAASAAFTQSLTYQRSMSRSGMGPRVLKGDYAPFAAEIEDLRQSAANGLPDIRRFREEIAQKIASEPATNSIHKFGEQLLASTTNLSEIDAKLGQARGTMGAFGERVDLTAARLTVLTKAMSDLGTASDALEAGRAYSLAHSYANGRAGKDDVYSTYQDRLQQLRDAAMPLPQPKPNLADYDTNAPYTASFRAAQDRIRSLIVETQALGKAVDAAEAFKLQQQMLTDLQRDGGVVTEGQRQQIDALAKAYGDLALAQKRMSLTRDLGFERDQIGRSPLDQQVATSMRSIYGDDYLAHMRDFGALQIRNNAALKAMADAGRSASDAMETMRTRLDLIGKPAAEVAKAMAALQADQNARASGIAGTSEAQRIRDAAVAQAGYMSVAERTLATWDDLKSAGESAIDSLVDKIGDGTLSLSDFLDVAKDLEKEFLKLAIANPLKNALFGENLPTLSAAQGILGQVFGGKGNPATDAAAALASSVGTMSVTATSVIVNGGLGANDNLASVLKPSGIGSDAVASKITGLNAGFGSKLSDFISGARDAGYGISVKSGFRTIERQQQLWDAALEKYGSAEIARKWVAPPGRSMHNFGQAADLGYSSSGAADWAHQNAGKYGLNFPLGNENWHVEPIGARAELAGRSLKDMSDAAAQTAKATSGLGSGLGDLTNSVSGAASKIGQLGASGGMSIPGFGGLGAVGGGGYTTSTGWMYANGGVFGPSGRMTAFASGGVIHEPTVFPFANGTGLMGEAGPEAIMPLRKLSNGRLGVEAGGKGSGGSSVNVVINNNAGNTAISQRESVNEFGQREVHVTINEAVAASIGQRGSPTFKALRAGGMRPPVTRRGG